MSLASEMKDSIKEKINVDTEEELMMVKVADYFLKNYDEQL